MNFGFVPWTNFADRFLNELNSKGKLCDLMIGDNQWLAPTVTTTGEPAYGG
jgi:multiple sugar transport system substrate-binding protein